MSEYSYGELLPNKTEQRAAIEDVREKYGKKAAETLEVSILNEWYGPKGSTWGGWSHPARQTYEAVGERARWIDHQRTVMEGETKYFESHPYSTLTSDDLRNMLEFGTYGWEFSVDNNSDYIGGGTIRIRFKRLPEDERTAMANKAHALYMETRDVRHKERARILKLKRV